MSELIAFDHVTKTYAAATPSKISTSKSIPGSYLS